MKKAIKKTCVVLLLFALLVSQVAASYSETGTLNEGTSAISAAERYLSNWAYNSYMYADKNLTLGTVLDAEVDPANDRLSQQAIQLVGVVDVLISLSHAKDGDFLRQMGVCEQAVALFISGDRHSVIGVFLVLHIFRPLIVAVKRSTP